tara:strand:- start:326 stop:526 length:201 start_codon:yes stop_codon:yes gene_type:complete
MLLTTNPVQGRVPVLSFLTFKALLVLNALVTWTTTRETRNTLLSLSNRELTDIGLTRGDVLRMARW